MRNSEADSKRMGGHADGTRVETRADTVRGMYVELSHDFIQLVRRAVSTNNLDDIKQGVALWCQNEPHWYQRFVWESLNLTPPRGQEPAPCRLEVERDVRNLAISLLQSNATCLFLLEDARPLADAYNSLGGKAILVEYNRRTLPGNAMLSYLRLFSLVNRSAWESNGDWYTFQSHYQSEFAEFLRSDIGRLIDQSIEQCFSHSDIAQLIISKSRITLVDTGMQGTFVNALAAWLRMRHDAGPDQIDLRLLATYPWLGKLYGFRTLSTSPGIVKAIEHRFKLAA